MKCFRCGSENIVKKTRYDPDTGEPRETQIPEKWVPFRIGDGQFGPDTHVTLCQKCSGVLVKVLRGEQIPAQKFDNQEVLTIPRATD